MNMLGHNIEKYVQENDFLIYVIWHKSKIN